MTLSLVLGVILMGLGIWQFATAFRLNTVDEGFAGPTPVIMGFAIIMIGIILACHP